MPDSYLCTSSGKLPSDHHQFRVLMNGHLGSRDNLAFKALERRPAGLHNRTDGPTPPSILRCSEISGSPGGMPFLFWVLS
jgi:hypothetical protein